MLFSLSWHRIVLGGNQWIEREWVMSARVYVAVSNRCLQAFESGGDLPDPIWANFIWLCSRIA